MDLGFFNKSKGTLKIMAILSVIAIGVIFYFGTPKTKLPIFNPVDVNPKLVDPSMKFMRRNHKIANFELVNQNGDTITDKNYEGKIYVADFFLHDVKKSNIFLLVVVLQIFYGSTAVLYFVCWMLERDC